MQYSSNRPRFFSGVRTAASNTAERAFPTSFAEKHRSLPARTIAMLIGALLLFAFCVFAMTEIATLMQAEDMHSIAQMVQKNVPGGTLSCVTSALPHSVK